jgi:hypothetical protein
MVSVSGLSINVTRSCSSRDQSLRPCGPCWWRASIGTLRCWVLSTQSGRARGVLEWRSRIDNRPNHNAIDRAPRHPAQHATETTAGLLARGSKPVTAFPGIPSGIVARARRLQLRGQLRIRNLRSSPHSLFALMRETVDRCTKRSRSAVVNASVGVRLRKCRYQPAVSSHRLTPGGSLSLAVGVLQAIVAGSSVPACGGTKKGTW